MSAFHGQLSRQSRGTSSDGDMILGGFDDEIVEIPGVSHSPLRRWQPKVEGYRPHTDCGIKQKVNM
ncbi:MAG: hypothetical protein FWC50_10555 [Planctomycetaceae bacterium]|nr:hypothetical protein [Planctomycetaceae bacterium]